MDPGAAGPSRALAWQRLSDSAADYARVPHGVRPRRSFFARV